MTRFLQVHSLALCVSLALILAAILSAHIILDSVIPIADGEGYAVRTFTLYGYLHTGQWNAFRTLLVRPGQSILPPQALLFFLLPMGIAGEASYIILQYLATYLVLAFAMVKAARILERPAWAPMIFLFVSVNNIALIDFYDFYLDMFFLAGGFLVIALQMEAWKENRARAGFLGGVALGLLFFIKPANAVIFLATYALSEMFFAIMVLSRDRLKDGFRRGWPDLFRQWGYRAAGFFPVLILVYGCNGGQTILQLIDDNEVHTQAADLDISGLLRLFYFPLCFSSCYHVLLLGGLLMAAFAASLWGPYRKGDGNAPAFPMHLLLPVLLAYLVLGEFFSFWMLVKPMRSVLLMLPLFGFVFCWLWERKRLALEPLVLATILYAATAYSQKAFNVMGTRDHLVEDNYPLTWSSWTEMPSAWHRGSSLNQAICASIEGDLPPDGIICVNAIEIRNSLMWRLNNGPLLQGKSAPYEVRNLFNFRGVYYAQSMNGASVISLVTFRPVQSTRAVWLQSLGILSYGNEEWVGKGLARAVDLPSIRGEPVGTSFVFAQPLSAADVALANNSAAFAGAVKDTLPAQDSLLGRTYTRAEAWELLRAWFNKRFN